MKDSEMEIDADGEEERDEDATENDVGVVWDATSGRGSEGTSVCTSWSRHDLKRMSRGETLFNESVSHDKK
jgi:hypothetical protein